ncbi:MAG: hypothetical protein U0169_26710 [Polyangiaceae bacterium]
MTRMTLPVAVRRMLGGAGGGLASRAAFVLSAVAGVLVLWETAAYYRRQDGFAFALVSLMAMAFGGGMIELWLRESRVARLGAELAALPTPATESAVDAASPELRGWIRARLQGTSTAWSQATFAPYLVGLLVMVGLLGTFLGLFETLRGAREALAMTTDPTTLRASLGAPMAGLTRSFGTSAAGVASSALLGLALVVSRRSDARFVRAFQAYTADALHPLTEGAKQRAAFEAVALGTAGFPDAIRSLERLATSLAGLQGTWASSFEELRRENEASEARRRDEHARFLRDQASSLNGLHERWLASVERVATRTGELAETVSSRAVDLSDNVSSRSAELSETVAKRTSELSDSVAKRTSELSESVAKRTSELADSVNARAAALEEAVRTANADHVAALSKTLGDETTRLAADVAAENAKLVERLASKVEGLLEALAGQSETVSTATATQARTLSDAVAAQTATLGESLRQQADTLASTLLERSEIMVDSLEARTASLSEVVTRHAETLADTLTNQSEVLTTAMARHSDLVATRLVASSEEIARGVTERSEASAQATTAQLVATEALVLRAAEQASEAGAAFAKYEAVSSASVEELTARVLELFEASSMRIGAFERELAGLHAALADSITERLETHAGVLREAVSEASSGVSSAAEAVRASGADMGIVAENLRTTIDAQKESASKWLETLSSIEDAVDVAMKASANLALEETLGRTEELFDKQLLFHRELFSQLRSIRGLGADEPAPRPGEARPSTTDLADGVPTEAEVAAELQALETAAALAADRASQGTVDAPLG